MKCAVVVFPGSNSDLDAWFAAGYVMGQDASLVWHKDTDLHGADMVILPGGFAHGDYLRAGAIARFSPIMSTVREFAARGGPVLGICNGFQVLLEAGLLPGAMVKNERLKFISRSVHVRVEQTDTPFTSSCSRGQLLSLPVAHGEGNYVADASGVDTLALSRQIIFRYADQQGNVGDDCNPNGSASNIAGICNRARNVVGLMPHPERACERLLGSADGRVIFESAIQAVSAAV